MFDFCLMFGSVCFWIFSRFAIFNHFSAETVRITVFLNDFLCAQLTVDLRYSLISRFNRSINIRNMLLEIFIIQQVIISRDSASWTGQVILQKKLPELHLSYFRKIITGNIRFVVLVFEDVIWYQKRCLISLIYLWMKQKEKKSKRWTRW